MGTCKQKEIRVIPTSDNVEFTSKSMKCDKIFYIMLKNIILNEGITSLHQVTQ